jgi:Mce-associated membrane protein
MAVDAAAAGGGLSSSKGHKQDDSEEFPTADGESTVVGSDDGELVDYEDDAGLSPSTGRWRSPLLLAGIMGAIAVVGLSTLTGWFGYRAYHAHQEKSARALFLQVARQGAVNLSTIDYQHADTDVQRIVDLATGQFHDEFAKRAQSFVDVVKKSQSSSTGTVAEAGLEAVVGDQARALVTVSVTSSVAGGEKQSPRSWRMRLTLQKSGNDVKVSNVEFVP